MILIKEKIYRLYNSIQSFSAGIVRKIPGFAKLFHIPGYRIKKVKAWSNRYVQNDDPGCSYQQLYTEIKAYPIKAKCPTCLVDPVHNPEKKATKHYNYWDIKSGFDSRNGFYHSKEESYDETYLLKLANAKILGPSGVVITEDGGLIEESIWTWDDWLISDRAMKSLSLPTPVKLNGTYYSVVSNYAEGYPHWLMELLPRLQGFLTLNPSEEAVIIYNSKLNRWQRETIEALGLSKFKSIYLEDSYYQIQNLYMPSYVGMPGKPHPAGCKWVRDTIFKNLGIEKSVPQKRVYINRRNAIKRRVLNEDQVMEVLKKYGFEEVAAENLSFSEQVKLFHSAEAIVATHGAGLGNLLFAQEQCKVLEILDRNYVNDQYYNLSSILGLDYYYQLEDGIIDSYRNKPRPGWDHLQVDAGKLEYSIKEMFGIN